MAMTRGQNGLISSWENEIFLLWNTNEVNHTIV